MKSSWVRVPGILERGVVESNIDRVARIGLLTIGVSLMVLCALVFRGSSGTAVLAAPASAAPATKQVPADQSKILETYGQLPLSFEPNAGQTDSRVKFLSRGPGYTVFLTNDEAVLALSAGGSKRKQGSTGESSALPMAGFRNISSPRPEPGHTTAVLRMQLIGANKNAQVAGADQLPGKTNYFLG